VVNDNADPSRMVADALVEEEVAAEDWGSALDTENEP
jgi:hypothetical protein